MQVAKALITAHLHHIVVEELEQQGYQCEVRPSIEYEELLKIISEYEVLIIRSRTKVNSELLDTAKKLKFIGRAGSGMENIDQAYAAQKGIQCFNSPEGNKDAVAEHVIGMMLTLLHNIAKSDRALRKKNWQRKANTGTELKGKTIGIIGYGNTGSALGEKLQAFGARLLVYDKYKMNFANNFIEEVSLKRLQNEADVVSLHVPLTSETQYWVGANFINSFKKKIILINASRGKVVQIQALLQALDTGNIRAAGLDVFENEKMETFDSNDWAWYENLIERENVILSPHIAGWSAESEYKIAYILSQKIKQSP